MSQLRFKDGLVARLDERCLVLLGTVRIGPGHLAHEPARLAEAASLRPMTFGTMTLGIESAATAVATLFAIGTTAELALWSMLLGTAIAVAMRSTSPRSASSGAVTLGALTLGSATAAGSATMTAPLAEILSEL